MIFSILTVLFLARFGICLASPPLPIQTKHVGPIVHTRNTTYIGAAITPSVDAFLGVPYAQPPIGPLRFAPPQPIQLNRSHDTIRATAFGPACFQFSYRTVFLDELVPTTEESEDCLSLNIFVPRHQHNGNASESKLLPVYVWSFGGAFGEGGGSVPLYNPAGLVQSAGDIIVITWNYRLNIFGFPAAPNSPQNLGLRDQRFALEWIRSNIASFGGDPTHIVLGGQSAGADSAAIMTYTHPDDPIVKGLVLQSGIPAYVGESDGSDWRRIVNLFGCGDEDLECMRRVPAAELSRAVTGGDKFHFFGAPGGGAPTVDNVTHFSRAEYLRRGSEGLFARVPTLLGTTHREGDGVVNWSPTSGINTSLSDAITTTFFTCPMALEASFRARVAPTWRYRFMFPFNTEYPPYQWLRGANYHVADVGFAFGSFPDPGREGKEVLEASGYFQEVLAAFIRDPERGLEGIGWPRYGTGMGERTLVELFPGGRGDVSFEEPGKYDAVCENPPEVCWECYVQVPGE